MITNSSDNNNNENSKIIKLKQSNELKQSGLVTNSLYYIDTHDVKISLNHQACTDIIFTIDRKKWQKNLNTIVEMAEKNGIHDTKSKHLLISHLNDNHDEILLPAANNNNSNKNNGKEELENSKQKPEFVTYKYSQMGRGDLHEAALIANLPYFLKFNKDSKEIEPIDKVEENNRILKPPEREEYPYTPYEFESIEELQFFVQKTKQIKSLDEPYLYAKSFFSGYIDQDEYIIILLAADSIGTYFQDLFPATHYSEGVGTNDVGKSSIGYTFEITGYRVVKATAMSGANYYRVLGSIEPGQCVIIEDEDDNISEDPDKVKILKTGYEYNGKVPKINMNTTKQEQKWYFAFCYKMILAEKSLKEYKVPGLVDRTFSFHCRPGKVKYSIKEVVSQNINKSPRLQKLYNELLCFRKLMLCYRLIHYKDLLPDIETGLENRDQELCKPLLQLFYGTKALEKEIIPTLEEFVKQRRTRKRNSLEAALYPIIKKFVFSEVGLDSSENIYSELKQKKTSVKVPFYRIWDYIKGGGINGQYDEDKNKYAYETIDYGTLYLNSLPSIIRDKFTATTKNETYGRALIFDVEKLERFEDLYSDNHLKGDNVKIEVKLKIEEEEEETEDSEDFGDLLGMHINNILEKSQQQLDNSNNSSSIGNKVESNSNNIEDAFQKSSESSESQESSVPSVINNQRYNEI